MLINMEEKQKKILIGVGAVTVVGAIIYFATKKPTSNTTTVVADTGLYRPKAPIETNPIEQIISGILGLFKKKKETTTAASGNCPSGEVPCALDKNKCYDPLANYKQDPCK